MRDLYKKNKLGYIGYVVLLTLFVSFSFGLKLGEVKLNGAKYHVAKAFVIKLKQSFTYDQTNNFFILILIGIVLFYLVRREYTKRCKVCSLIFSLCSSTLLLIARTYYQTNKLDRLFVSKFAMFKGAVVLAGYTIVTYFLINAFFEYLLPKLRESNTVRTFTFNKFKIRFWTCFAAIMIAWLPYAIVCYPCNFCRDARDEIAQMQGDEDISRTAKSIIYPEGAKTLLNNHHPITYTLLLGTTAKIGFAIGNINHAMFLLALLQMVALAMIYSYTVVFIKRLGVPKVFQYLTLAFFMFFPLIPMYAFTLTKDGLFGGFMILVTIGLFKMVVNEEEVFSSRKEKLAMLFSCVGLTLFRNNGLYVLFIVFFILLIKYRKSFARIKGVLFMVGIPIVFYWIILLKIILPLCSIPGGSPREMLSIPFQQVARYASVWGEKGFEEGEIEKLDKILQFDGDIKVLKKRYDPVLSDPVKNKFNKNYTKEELKDFMGVWAKLLARHPATFVDATLNNVYYLFSVEYDRHLVYSGVLSKEYWYGLKSPTKLSHVRNTYVEVLKMFNESSMLGWAFSIGTWDYMFLLCMLFVIYKKKYNYLLLTIPVVVNVLICVAGPIVYMRYAIEWIVVLPLFGAMIWLCLKQKQETAELEIA